MSSDTKSSNAKVVPIKASASQDPAARAKFARLPAPVHAVQERGKQLFAQALSQVFDNADDALFALADKAINNQDQNLYFESMREVRIRRREVEARCAQAVDDAFIRLVVAGSPAEDDAYAYANQSISANNLTLVEDDELEELVALDAMITKATQNGGESLQFLSLRLDSLVPNKVYDKSNPLGPHVVCNAFVGAVRTLEADIKAKLVLFKLFEQYVIAELPGIYEKLNTLLVEHKVLPSIQRPRSGGSAPAAGQAAAATRSAPDSQPPNVATAPSGAGVAVNSGIAGVSASGGAELMTALGQLQGYHQAQLASGSGTSVAGVNTDVASVLLKLLEQRGGAEAAFQQPHLDTMHLVKLLFDFILDDRQLAEPIKALLGRLQIPIVKVALLDESFFKRKGHPARRLLNEMATAALGWQENPADKGAPKDPLYQKISAGVQRVLAEFEEDQSVFNDVLADFVSFVERERKRALILEQRTIDAEDGKARAEAARKQVSEALAGLMAGRNLPPGVRNMLDPVWSNVLFLVCLKQGSDSPEWEDALQTAEDLIWSVTCDVDVESRQQLLAMIPGLVRRLRQGLEMIAYNPFEMTQLLGRLEKLHLARLQPQREMAPEQEAPAKKEPVAAPEQEIVALASEPEEKPETPAAEQPTTPVVDSGANDEKSPESVVSDVAAEQVAEPAAPAEPAKVASHTEVAAESVEPELDAGYLALVKKLTQGSWFEMEDEGEQRFRCRLAAIIRPTGKYIFVNRNGMKVAEKTQESLAQAMKEDKIRLLDDSMLFDRALESVIASRRQPR